MSKLLLGILTGIAVGILVAPAKGSETRKKLEDSWNDIYDKAEDFVNEVKEAWKEGTEMSEDPQPATGF